MKKTIIFLILALLLSILLYVFFFKNYIQTQLIYKIPNSSEDFYPQAYQFFHSESELNSYINHGQTKVKYQNKFEKIQFDFINYTYLIVYGREIQEMYYSYKTTFFDDISPSYARPKGKIPVFINYKSNGSKGVFIYKIEKDIRLRGFYGV